MQQVELDGGTLYSKLSDVARRLFGKYKAEGISYRVVNHPDYKGCYLAEDTILGVQAVGDKEVDAIENLIDCVDQFVYAALDTEDEEAIDRLVITPLVDGGV